MSSVIFSGAYVKALKAALRLKDQATIWSGSSDPTSTPTFGRTGDLYIRFGATPGFYQKITAEGTDTNWEASATASEVADKIDSSEKGANNGVATLDAGGKIPAAQLPNSVLTYEGTWDASTNTPTLADGTGDAGMVYLVNVAGTQNLGSGAQTFAIGDWVVYSGSIWQKSTNSNAVVTVNGQTGVVVLDTGDIAEDTNLYFTDERAQDAVGTILADSSQIAFTYTDSTPAITASIKPGSVTNTEITNGTIDLTSKVTGALPVANGGTALTALGTANKVLGTNNAANALEYKSILGTTNMVDVTHAAGSITLSLPQAINTGNSVIFNNITSQGTIQSAGGFAFYTTASISTTGTLNNVSTSSALSSSKYFTGASTQTVTGLASGYNGYFFLILNTAAQDLLITNQDSGSIAANRIITPTGATVSVPPGATAFLRYDSAASRWRFAASFGDMASVTGVLPIANGGTASSAALSNNRVMKSSGSAIIEAAAITAARALISDSNGIPTHSTVTDTELGYVSGVTSAIQTQLNNKITSGTAAIVNADISASAAIARSKTASGTAYRILANDAAGVMSENAAITASRAVVSDANGQLVAATTTATELGYVNGVTSAIQTQIDGKQASGNYITALTTDVAASGPGSVVATIQANVVTNAKLAQMAAHTFKGNNTGSTTDALDLTATQLTAELNNFVGDSGSGGTKGLVPAPASGDAAANKFLKADGSWTSVATARSVSNFSGTTVSPAANGDETFYYTGSSAQVLTSMGTLSGLTNGKEIRFMGSSDTNTITINLNDASDGWLVNGSWIGGRGENITFEYNSTLARFVEVGRSN